LQLERVRHFEPVSCLCAHTGNMASGGAAGACSLAFVYSLDYARTRLANDAKGAKKGGGERQFNGLVDVYRKTLASDGIAGLYRGFVISCVGIVVYRGLYFGMYDSIKPVLLTGNLEDSFLAAFLLGWAITIGAGGCWVVICLLHPEHGQGTLQLELLLVAAGHAWRTSGVQQHVVSQPTSWRHS
jgi:hypothetical protein